MSFRIDVQRSKFFSSLNDIDRKKFFDLKLKKYVHNIDTLYYSVFIQNDDNSDALVESLIFEVSELKMNLINSNEDSLDYCLNLEMMRGRHSDYAYRLSYRDCFDIYITSHIANNNTPRILVQIRSFWLWTHGVDESINYSFSVVVELLSQFNLVVSHIQENRIDYCYHTNSVQNPSSFFSLEKIKTTLKTSFSKYKVMGDIYEGGYTIDYLSLGSQKANNLFFRIYNKTREVIEMGYKSFFLDIWYEQGLISFYDKFCLEYAYCSCNYEKVYEGALKFYLKFGNDDFIKKDITSLFSSNYSLKDVKKMFDTFMPSVTIVINIEFETKRKYYQKFKDISVLPSRCDDNRLDRIYKIIDNRKIFLDILTSDVVRFEKNNKLMDFWKRLVNLKISSISNDSIKATYNNNLDLDKIRSRVLNSIASYSIYNNNFSTDLDDDIMNLLSSINDNTFSDEYSYKKNKKYKQIKNRLLSE